MAQKRTQQLGTEQQAETERSSSPQGSQAAGQVNQEGKGVRPRCQQLDSQQLTSQRKSTHSGQQPVAKRWPAASSQEAASSQQCRRAHMLLPQTLSKCFTTFDSLTQHPGVIEYVPSIHAQIMELIILSDSSDVHWFLCIYICELNNTSEEGKILVTLDMLNSGSSAVLWGEQMKHLLAHYAKYLKLAKNKSAFVCLSNRCALVTESVTDSFCQRCFGTH